MKKRASDEATRGREDLSRFVVHLTRDDRHSFTNGRTAPDNFRSILRSRRLLAAGHHCLHHKKLDRLPESLRKRMKVVCLMEVPLNQLHQVVRTIPGRRIELAPYGVVFTKDFITSSGGQPSLYVNAYGSNWLREAADQLLDCVESDGAEYDKLWRFLPFINVMHASHDFSWEREWRVVGDLKFAHDDLVGVVLPDEGETKLKEALARAGIAAISPEWSYEQIVGELARQQRTTKRLVLP